MLTNDSRICFQFCQAAASSASRCGAASTLAAGALSEILGTTVVEDTASTWDTGSEAEPAAAAAAYADSSFGTVGSGS